MSSMLDVLYSKVTPVVAMVMDVVLRHTRIIKWFLMASSHLPWAVYVTVKSIHVYLFTHTLLHLLSLYIVGQTFFHAFKCFVCLHNVCVCVCVCVYVCVCVCKTTDIVKDAWLGRLYTCTWLCVPGEQHSVIVLTGWPVSEHLSQGHPRPSTGLDRLTPLSDLRHCPPTGPPASPAYVGVCLCDPPRQDSFRSGL